MNTLMFSFYFILFCRAFHIFHPLSNIFLYFMNTRGSTSKTSGTAHGKRKAPGGNKSTSRNKATGRKGNTSTFSGTHDVEITEENMAFFKAMQAKLKAEKKATSESQDEGKLN